MSAVRAGKRRHGNDGTARHYVNAFSATVSLSSIDFDLSALGAGGEGKDRVWHFVTTPSRFRSFHTKLGKAIDSYRRQFGEIASPEADDSDDERGDSRG